MRIMHPTDFSHTAEKARVLALDLSGRLGAKVHVVHVQERYQVSSFGPHLVSLNPDLLKLLEEQRSEEARQLRESLANLTPPGGSSELRWGRPLPELLELAPNFDLIVMGAHGANRLDNFFLGGVAGRLVRRSPTPVLTVRDEAQTTTVQRILVATDFSPAAENAWRWCCALAERDNLALSLAHVLVSKGPQPLAQTREAVEKLEALACGRKVHHLLREGDPVSILPQLALEEGADVIAIGVKRRSAAIGLLFGSRADGLIRSSPVPILSVPLTT
jgi:nucleotide-binding universal stress UspA family protein